METNRERVGKEYTEREGGYIAVLLRYLIWLDFWKQSG